MTKQLLLRPIAVTMCLIAVVVMGCLALRYIPISLMPDIDVPQITVQTNMPGYSAREIDKEVISKLRGQLMQVAGVKDIRSEARMDAGYVMMTFEPGSNTSLSFIEMNEEIDWAIKTMPKDIEHPKVVMASALDIPAFYLDIWLKNESNSFAFAQLGGDVIITSNNLNLTDGTEAKLNRKELTGIAHSINVHKISNYEEKSIYYAAMHCSCCHRIGIWWHKSLSVTRKRL